MMSTAVVKRTECPTRHAACPRAEAKCVGTGCPAGLVPWLPCDGRNPRCPLVTVSRPVGKEVPPAEGFGPDRHLVTYRQTSFWAFASSRDDSDAIDAPARRERSHGSDPCSRVLPAKSVGCVVCWPA